MNGQLPRAFRGCRVTKSDFVLAREQPCGARVTGRDPVDEASSRQSDADCQDSSNPLNFINTCSLL
jgi:hypothetical protein